MDVTQPKATNIIAEPRMEYISDPHRLERLYTLLKQINDKTVFDIDSIAEQLKITTRTIRRDLELLELFGWIKRVGATRNRSYFLTELGLSKITENK